MVHEAVHTPAVERAVARAHTHGITAELVNTVPLGYTATEYYHVASFSQRGKVYLVSLTYSAAGIDAVCNCEAGYFGTICQHVAVALEAAECLPAALAAHPEENEPSIVVHPSADTWLDQVMRGDI